jgi:hypothetical protein
MAKLLAIVTMFASALQGEVPTTPFLTDPSIFRCSPAVVGPNDTVVLSKHSRALRELAVLRPGATTPHFVVVDLPPQEMTPLMSPDELGVSKEIRIPVAELTGLEWSVNAAPEPIFTVPGTYQFWLSPNLESEDGAYVCRVEYQPLSKRANNSSKPTPLRGAA